MTRGAIIQRRLRRGVARSGACVEPLSRTSRSVCSTITETRRAKCERIRGCIPTANLVHRPTPVPSGNARPHPSALAAYRSYVAKPGQNASLSMFEFVNSPGNGVWGTGLCMVVAGIVQISIQRRHWDRILPHPQAVGHRMIASPSERRKWRSTQSCIFTAITIQPGLVSLGVGRVD